MRTQTMAFTAVTPATVNMAIVQGETLALSLVGTSASRHVLTISDTPGGTPLVEVPAIGPLIMLEPGPLQILQEGRVYHYNIWAQDGANRMQLAAGRVAINNSILPTDAEFFTAFLSGLGLRGGPQRIILLSDWEYAALSPPDPDTLYLIREGA